MARDIPGWVFGVRLADDAEGGLRLGQQAQRSKEEVDTQKAVGWSWCSLA